MWGHFSPIAASTPLGGRASPPTFPGRCWWNLRRAPPLVLRNCLARGGRRGSRDQEVAHIQVRLRLAVGRPQLRAVGALRPHDGAGHHLAGGALLRCGAGRRAQVVAGFRLAAGARISGIGAGPAGLRSRGGPGSAPELLGWQYPRAKGIARTYGPWALLALVAGLAAGGVVWLAGLRAGLEAVPGLQVRPYQQLPAGGLRRRGGCAPGAGLSLGALVVSEVTVVVYGWRFGGDPGLDRQGAEENQTRVRGIPSSVKRRRQRQDAIKNHGCIERGFIGEPQLSHAASVTGTVLKKSWDTPELGCQERPLLSVHRRRVPPYFFTVRRGQI